MSLTADHFGGTYYTKFKQVSSFKNWLYEKLIDCRQPVFFHLLRRFPRNSRLLDFGCGSGLFARQAVRYFNYTGVDFSAKALRLARKNSPKTTFICGSVNVLKKTPANRYDVIVCFDVLEHVDKVEGYLKEFKRVLKPDGWLVTSMPIADSLSLQAYEQRWLGFEDPSHIRILARSDWHALFRRHGLIPIHRWSSGIINSPTPRWTIHGSIKLLHYITQPLGLLGVPLPARFTDEDYYVMIKNPHCPDRSPITS